MKSLARGARISTILFTLCTATTSLWSVGAAIEIENRDPEQTKELVKSTFTKIDASYRSVEETQGFKYRYDTAWYSPYRTEIYISPYKNGSIVHIDSPKRMSYAIGDVLLQENGAPPFENKYEEKSLALGSFFTVLSPGFGSLYADYNTPFTDGPKWARVGIQFGIDAVLLFIGGKTFFTHGFDPLGRGLIATSALLGTYRAARLVPLGMQIIAHNRLVGLGYTFRF